MDETDILETAERWILDGHAVALATVVKTWGSAPRPAGSHMAVRTDGLFEGSVSGGCVEAEIIEAARETIRDGEVRYLRFGVSDEKAWSAGLACGGQIEIFIEPIV